MVCPRRSAVAIFWSAENPKKTTTPDGEQNFAETGLFILNISPVWNTKGTAQCGAKRRSLKPGTATFISIMINRKLLKRVQAGAAAGGTNRDGRP